jgi:hypothetical protein
MADMTLRDPVLVYHSANNIQAHLVQNALLSAGIEAFVAESFYKGSQAQVWVERAEIERAKPILDEYERRSRARRDADISDPAQAGPPIEVACRACGQRTTFSSIQRESVQECPQCGAYVDVVDDKTSENGSD